MIDLNNAKITSNRFGGSERKTTVIYNNRFYMVKFPDPIREKNNDLSYMNNVFSEDIGCKILKSIGFEVQNTFLAKYNFNGKEKIVVACEDFCQDGAVLLEFSKLLLSDADSPRLSKSIIAIEDVVKTIDSIPDIGDKQSFKNQFWNLFVADTLIGNKDRHSDNWGFLYKNGEVTFAPIYDCGSALSPLLSDEILPKILSDESRFKEIEYNLFSPYSYKGAKIFYVPFYKNPPLSLQKALKNVVPKIDMEKIKNIIDNTECLSDIRKEYLFKAVNYRYENILVATLKRTIKQEKLQQVRQGKPQGNGR